MFTGLVQSVGVVAQIQRHGKGVRLGIDPGRWSHRPSPGASISVSGCCLTIAGPSSGAKRAPTAKSAPRPRTRILEFDVIQETLDKTRLGSLRVGSRVNLEHAVTPATLLGGHLVQGHVDGVARVVKVQTGNDWRVWFELPSAGRASASTPSLAEYVIPKGSITVDGVSLTIAGLWGGARTPDDAINASKADGARAKKPSGKRTAPRGFMVALIPTTLKETTLCDLRVGEVVNIEVDMMVKTVVYWLREFGTRR